MVLTAALIAAVAFSGWRGGGPLAPLWVGAWSLYAAWVVPWWYLFDRLFAALQYGLGAALKELDRVDTVTVVAQVSGTTRELLLYAGERGLRHIEAPAVAFDVLPEAVAVVLPLLESPLGGGLAHAKREAGSRLRPWQRRLRLMRIVWGMLLVGPLTVVVVYWSARALGAQ